MFLKIALGVLGLSIFIALIRLVKGPSIPDRAVAYDTIATNILGVFVVLSMIYGTTVFYDAVLVVALLGFMGTVAFAHYLERGDIVQ